MKYAFVCEYFQLLETTDEIATYETKRRGEQPIRLSYTIGQARNAGLGNKDTWKGHAQAMLRARASMALARAVYPDVTSGHVALEEYDDTPTAEAPAMLSAEAVAAKVVDTAESISNDEIVAALAGATTDAELTAAAGALTKAHPAQRDAIKSAFRAARGALKALAEVPAGEAEAKHDAG